MVYVPGSRPRSLGRGAYYRHLPPARREELQNERHPDEAIAYIMGSQGQEGTYFAIHQKVAKATYQGRSTVSTADIGALLIFGSEEELMSWVSKAEQALAEKEAATVASAAVSPVAREPRRIEDRKSMVALSESGLIRENNEDLFIIEIIPALEDKPAVEIAIVADGMGGANAGEVASRLAAETIRDHLVANIIIIQTGDATAIENLIEAAIALANEAVYAAAAESSKRGMGTTIDVIVKVGKEIYYGHVGDGRIYRIRLKSPPSQVTTDDAYYIRARKYLSKVVGMEDTVEPTTGHFTIEEGERVLFGTDGLWDFRDDPWFIARMKKETEKPLLAFGNGIIDAALTKGSRDNITVIVLEERKNET